GRVAAAGRPAPGPGDAAGPAVRPGRRGAAGPRAGRAGGRAMTGGPPLLSLPKAAERFGVSEKVLRRLAALGALPGAVHVGGRWYVKTAALRRWLESDGKEQDDG